MRDFAIGVCTLLWMLPLSADDAEINLADYSGLFEYSEDARVQIAHRVGDEMLYAIISGARYPLRPLRKDVFLNAGNVEVHFARDADGQVMGFRERRQTALTQNRLFRLIDRSAIYPASAWVARSPLDAGADPYVVPGTGADGIDVAEPGGDSFLRTRLSDMTEALWEEQFPGVHGVLVYQGDSLVYERYFYDFDGQRKHQLRSATKTLMALLAVIAIDNGLVPSTEAAALAYFPEYEDLKHPHPDKARITVHDLLSMQSGFACNDWDADSPGNESRMMRSDDWPRYVFDLPMAHPPGTQGSYCSGNVTIIGRIIEKASGMPLKTFADQYLFGPLGISDVDWDFRPDRSNLHNFTQAWMRPRDMLKIGLLLKQRGRWKDQQIVSAGWIDRLRAAHSEIGGTPYGYFWWRRYVHTADGVVQTPQASGNGGQKIILLDAADAVVVFTGGNYNDASHVNDLLIQYLIPGLVENP